MGLQNRPSQLKLNDHDVGSTDWEYDNDGKVLRVSGLGAITSDGAWNGTWTLEWS